MPGPENNADLTTRHLLAGMIRRHTTQRSLEFRESGCQKAVNLQSVAAREPAARPREQWQQEARDKLLAVYDRYAGRHGRFLELSRSRRRVDETACRAT